MVGRRAGGVDLDRRDRAPHAPRSRETQSLPSGNGRCFRGKRRGFSWENPTSPGDGAPAAQRATTVAERPRRRLLDAVPAALEAGAHGALISGPLGAGIAGRHAAIGLRGIKSRLALRPLVALVFVPGLLLVRLPVLRVHKHVAVLAGRRRRRIGARGIRIAGRVDYFILAIVAISRCSTCRSRSNTERHRNTPSCNKAAAPVRTHRSARQSRQIHAARCCTRHRPSTNTGLHEGHRR